MLIKCQNEYTFYVKTPFIEDAVSFLSFFEIMSFGDKRNSHLFPALMVMVMHKSIR